jgi:hypothetical protein
MNHLSDLTSIRSLNTYSLIQERERRFVGRVRAGRRAEAEEEGGHAETIRYSVGYEGVERLRVTARMRTSQLFEMFTQ